MMLATQSEMQQRLHTSLKPREDKHTVPMAHAIAAGGVQSKKQLVDLNVPKSLARIVHQSDKSGKQQSVLLGRRRDGSTTSDGQRRGSFRNLFTNVFSVLGINEKLQTSINNKQSLATIHSTAIELRQSVLPPLSPNDADKKCLVLDLDETLVHSSFQPTSNPDIIIPVENEGTVHQVYVHKRPGVEEFLIEMAKYFEIVVYTASLSMYADPLLDKLDPEGVIRYRLFREHCVQYEDSYVKDLSLLDRDISQTIIIDNAPISYLLHPRNAIGCSSFIDDPNDCELESISRFLTKFHDVDDVRDHLHIWNANY
ncbi:hypothetical protein PsorP6_001882 [Peronosclerospora sorghi]|uniref:Uncharacterized protein n=1 Tax=Peronosclerospora sorghi TaxID=230839 RepID=A0ACC0WUN4_9STRA|nr:hypothetical protein PsorP6_001882 [Peronosclerospora sorghi]